MRILVPAVTCKTDKVGQDKTKDKVKKDSSAPTKGATNRTYAKTSSRQAHESRRRT